MMMALVIMTGCGKNSTVLTISGQEVPLGEAVFILRELETMYENQYGPQIWQSGYEGQTFDEIAKQGAIDSITRLYITNMIAADKGIVLTAEEEQEIDVLKEEYLAQVSEEALSDDGISITDLRNIFVYNAIGEKLMNEELVDFVVDEATLEAALAADQSYQQIQKYGYEGVLEQVTAQHILISIVNEDRSEKTDDEKAKALETAELVLSKVNNGEDFESLVAEYTEDPGSVENGGTYTFYKGEMAAEFEEAAFNMEIDQVSGLVETQFGYHIIKKLDHIAPEEEDVKNVMEYEGFLVEQYKLMQKQVEYDSLFEVWKESYEVELNEKAWEKVQTTNQRLMEEAGVESVLPDAE